MYHPYFLEEWEELNKSIAWVPQIMSQSGSIFFAFLFHFVSFLFLWLISSQITPLIQVFAMMKIMN